jgi:hypothetical protein
MRIVEIRERFRSHFALCCSPGCTADADNEHRRRHHRCHHSGRSGDRLWVFVFGRYAQSELIHERFAPRLLHAWPSSLTNAAGTNLDPFRAWETMMRCEKPGARRTLCRGRNTRHGHLGCSENRARSGARLSLSELVGKEPIPEEVPGHAAGGYQYLSEDIQRLSVRRFLDQGYQHLKIKIAATSLCQDLERIDAVLRLLQAPDRLAVDGTHAYDRPLAMRVASTLRGYGLRPKAPSLRDYDNSCRKCQRPRVKAENTWQRLNDHASPLESFT